MDRTGLQRRAARWFGGGLVAAPLIDIANDRGILQVLGTLDFALLLDVPWIGWGHLAFFVGIGIAAAWLMARLSARMQQIFFWGCAIPLFGYAIAAGLTLSVVAGALSLCLAYVQLRFANDLA